MRPRLGHLQKKKIEHSGHVQTVANNETQPSYQPTPQPFHNSQVNKGQPMQLPRPILAPTNQIRIFDRRESKKTDLPYPPPESLYKPKYTEIDPLFIRTSCTTLSTQVQKTSFPIGLWVTPFANEVVCTVELKAPLRCNRCKAYINPYFQFDGSRRAATCNLCGLKYGIDESTDKLNMTSTEVATQSILDFQVSDKFYMKKRKDIIKVIILVEFTLAMMEHGICATILDSIKNVLESHQFEQNIRIGVAFYSDQGVGFIRVGEEGGQPGVFMVPLGKGATGCCPLSQEQFLVDPTTQKQSLASMLEFMQNYWESLWKKSHFIHQANYVFALRCMRDSFQQQTGRILLFSLLDPRQPPCPIGPRNQEQSKTPLKPIHTEAYEYAKQLLRARIGVDHFVFSRDALISHELATTHFLSSTTGGKMHLYTHYNNQTHGQHLYYAIFHSLTKKCYYDIDFTCRASNGLTVTRYGAADGPRESRDVSLSVADPTSSFTIQIEQQEKLEQHNGAFIQFAAMYTTGNGERKIRVINFKFQVSSRPGALYQSVDYLTFSSILLRNCSARLIKGADPAKVRDDAINLIGVILGDARAKCPSINISVAGMNMPPGLARSLSYLSSVLNSRLFLKTMKMFSDEKIMKYLQIQQSNPYFFTSKFYPRLYPLTFDIYEVEEGQPMPGDFIEDEEEEQNEEEKIAILPPNLPLSKQSFKSNGVYLVDNGQELVVFVQNQADDQIKMQLFGTTDWNQIAVGGLPELQSSHSIRIANIVAELRRRSAMSGGMYQSLSIKTPLKKGPYQQMVANLLIQDQYECELKMFLEQVQKAIVTPK